MDDERHSRKLQAYRSARTSATIGGSVAAFLAFVIFMIVGYDIQVTAAWMFALGLLTFSGVFVATYIASASAKKRTPVGS